MMKLTRVFAAFLLSATLGHAVALPAHAASEAKSPKQIDWPFDGFTGTVDRQAAQRGFQVYKEVCASCHGLGRVAYRNLTQIGFSEDEAKAIAAQYTVTDGPNDDGEMFDRPAKPFDRFVGPFPNEKAARASNNGAYPPDLSLIVKARENGANYTYSLLTGYQDAPAHADVPDGMYYNPYFSGSKLAMAPPLMEGLVEYQDGTVATVDQMARDTVIFLQWAAEPEMEERKGLGLKVLIFLLITTVLFYFAKKRVWSDVH